MQLQRNTKIYVAGHAGMVGSAIVRALRAAGFTNLVTRTHAELDLTDRAAVDSFFAEEKPDLVFLAAARVGGIEANRTAKADFLYDNMLIGLHVMRAAAANGCRKLLNLGSSCIYPRLAEQPIREEALLSGPLEETNEGYALAKISVLKYGAYLEEQGKLDVLSLMPCNLYGPNDNYDLRTSHVLPALIRRFHEAKESGAKEVVCWGDGSPLREFLYVDDLAEACLQLAQADAKGLINIGSGKEVTIRQLAELIAKIVGYEGEISWDPTKPNGTPRKVMDVSRAAALGWQYKTELDEGIRRTYADYLAHLAKRKE